MTTPASRDLAIKYALDNQWEDAYRENKKLLEENPNDVDTTNRLAYSLVKLGKFKKAKEFYSKVLKIDKTNPIATKNLKRIETISKRSADEISAYTPAQFTTMTDSFIEEAGKTKTLDLKNVADKKTLSLLQPGDPVSLAIKRSKVFVLMNNKTFIGMLPDSIGMRMIPLMTGGNEYTACIKSLGVNSASVFIKETKRMPKFKNHPSFLPTLNHDK